MFIAVCPEVTWIIDDFQIIFEAHGWFTADVPGSDCLYTHLLYLLSEHMSINW